MSRPSLDSYVVEVVHNVRRVGDLTLLRHRNRAGNKLVARIIPQKLRDLLERMLIVFHAVQLLEARSAVLPLRVPK